MSFFDDASLVLLTSGAAGKDGKAYSIKPTDGTGDFTFSRGSNLTATRVGPTGLIEKGRENLLKRSNDFSDILWVQSATTRTSGQAGYDGSSDAWEVTRASGGSVILYQAEATSGVNTFSVYVKVNASNGFGISFDSSSYAYFDISDTTRNGAVATNAIVTSSQTYIGNNFYRLSVTASGSFSQVRFTNCSADGTTADAFGGTHIIQDAQLEVGLAATDYIESGASTGKAGLLENEPRFDYSGGATCPSLLLEPQRVNLIPYSEYFDSWSKIGSPTITNNYGISPEGLQNSTRLQTTSDRISISVGTINANETFSIYMKGSGTLRIDLGGTNNFYPTLTSEWVRYEFITTQAGSNTNIQIRGNGSAVDLELYGAQMEQGSYPTSYIPNHSGGSATRTADDLNDLDISSMLTTSSFTWFLDLNDYIGSDINTSNIWLQSTSSSIEIQFRVRPDGYRFYYSGIAGGSVYPINGSKTANKFCLSYDGSNYRLYVDGVLQDTTASVGDSGWDKIRNSVLASLPLKQMLLFPEALSDADCITLTT